MATTVVNDTPAMKLARVAASKRAMNKMRVFTPHKRPSDACYGAQRVERELPLQPAKFVYAAPVAKREVIATTVVAIICKPARYVRPTMRGSNSGLISFEDLSSGITAARKAKQAICPADSKPWMDK